MKNRENGLGRLTTLLVVFTVFVKVSYAGEFTLSESRSKTVLIAAHNTDPADGWPTDKFDGTSICTSTSTYPSYGNPSSVFPTTTTHSLGDCPNVVAHLRNADSIYTSDAYQKANTMFTEQAGLLWNYNAAKEFTDRKKADGLLKEVKRPLVPVLTFTIYEYVITYNSKDDVHTGQFFEELNYDYGEFHYSVTLYGFPEKKDIVSGILMLQYLVNKAEITKRKASFTFEVIDRNKGKLGEKTLVLTKDNLNPDLDEEKMKAAYPYKFSVVEDKELSDIIENRKAGYAYVLAYPISGLIPMFPPASATKDNIIERALMQIVIDAETGETLSFATKGMPCSTTLPNLPVTENELEMFVKKAK